MMNFKGKFVAELSRKTRLYPEITDTDRINFMERAPVRSLAILDGWYRFGKEDKFREFFDEEAKRQA